MALIIDLKPHEKIIIGESLITNDKTKARFHIEGNAPIMREKDIMLERDANSACKKLYLTVQLMYLSPNPKELHKIYFELVHQIQTAAPSTAPIIMEISAYILADKYYKALKEARKLIEYEQELINNVK